MSLEVVILALIIVVGGGHALAQHGGGPPPPGGGGPPGLGGRADGGPPPNLSGTPVSTLRGGLQLGPPGRWWDDKEFARGLGLAKEQQHRMDEVFKENKGSLIKFDKALQREEGQLQKVTRAKMLNEGVIDAQIDRVVQARGDLEKAYAHMQLAIRKEMTPEQAEKLEEHRPDLAPETR